MTDFSMGASSPRVELSAKLDGRARYVDDLSMPGMIHGLAFRSPVARARIKSIQLGPLPEGMVIVRVGDIPGENIVRILSDDQPLLAEERINHCEEPLLLMAHPDREVLLDYRDTIKLELIVEEPVLDLKSSIDSPVAIHRDGNLLKQIIINKGDPADQFADADLVVEGEYTTGAQEQAYIEPQGVIAWMEDGRYCVRGSMQCPYYVHKTLCGIFGVGAESIRVIQDTTGGGFGGKEEYPSVLAAHACLLAMKSGRPVKMIYDRAEDMAVTTKRHPSFSRVRLAFNKDGKLLAQQIEFNLDAGAYVTLTPVVLSRGALHASGPYSCDHVEIKARAWATNTPPHGAFRGFGAPQSCFAIEAAMDEAAHQLKLDPSELRRINFLQKGDTTATGQIIQEEIDLSGLLDRALAGSDYEARKGQIEQLNQQAGFTDPIRGIGLSSFFHGAGFTGSGERLLKSRAALVLEATGDISVRVASTEIGQGANTIFTQIVCDTLGVPASRVTVHQPDTDHVPDSGPTVASRTTMVVGSLIRNAALDLASALNDFKQDGEDLQDALERMAGSAGRKRFEADYEQPAWVVWDDQSYVGDAYPTYAWAVYVAETELDPLTSEARVTAFLALQDIGTVINPQLAEGQVEGGVAQGIGFALLENVVWKDGRMANNRLSDYILPTFMDLPHIRVDFRQTPWGYGPGGAKGLGELPMDGTAPAVLSALSMSLGRVLRTVPALPEDLLPLVEEARR
jgi:CO/xanthine dehydrogenase Mo-binding subunit